MLNSYRIFSEFLKEKMGINDEKLIEEKYFGIKSKEINKLIENIKKINIGGENGLTIKEKIERTLQKYYSETKMNKMKL